jgi:hypothetical protein
MSTNKDNDIQIVFTSEKIEEIRLRAEQGFKTPRHEKYWAENYVLTKRDGIVFTLNDDETLEYIKCKLGVDINDDPYVDPNSQILKMSGIEYFAEQYCKVKNELGRINNIRLRDYQKDILNMFIDNRFSIVMASRQIGKCNSFIINVLTKEGSSKMYRIWFKSLKKKTLYDYIKYSIYYLIDKLSK